MVGTETNFCLPSLNEKQKDHEEFLLGPSIAKNSLSLSNKKDHQMLQHPLFRLSEDPKDEIKSLLEDQFVLFFNFDALQESKKRDADIVDL